MALEVITTADGRKVVKHTTPHNRVDNTITAPSYDAVLEAMEYLKAAATEHQLPYLAVLDKFLKTR